MSEWEGLRPPTASAVPPADCKEGGRRRFRLACRMLRSGRHFENELPFQKRGESPIDWLVRFKLAPSPLVAAEMLILGAGLTSLLDELERDKSVVL